MHTLTATTTTTASAATGRRPSRLALVAHLARDEQRAFFRNRSRAFFSFALPLVFLVVFNAINGGHRIDERGNISYATWFVPGILAYAVIMTTFTNLATSIVVQRDQGVLKRMRTTPMPAWTFLAARIVAAAATTALMVAVTLALGTMAYGVEVRAETLPGLVVGLLAGTACFTSLGIALTTMIRNGDGAPAVVNVAILPLTFISGIWMVLDNAPAWLARLADVFPVKAFADLLQRAFDPATAGPGLFGHDLLVLAAWTAFGIVAGLRWFRWESRR